MVIERIRDDAHAVDERPREKELLEINGEREIERFKKYIIWKYRELRCESGVPVHAKRNTGHLVSPTAVVATTTVHTNSGHKFTTNTAADDDDDGCCETSPATTTTTTIPYKRDTIDGPRRRLAARLSAR